MNGSSVRGSHTLDSRTAAEYYGAVAGSHDDGQQETGPRGFDRYPEKYQWLHVVTVLTRCILALAFGWVIICRIGTADFSWLAAGTFDFTQLLNLLLAFFAIGLSALFYFKATETSNAFYDRTYRFTKDLFEKLARIEERFGELLKGIHEDTSRTRDYMQSANQSKISVTTDAPAATPESVKAPDPGGTVVEGSKV